MVKSDIYNIYAVDKVTHWGEYVDKEGKVKEPYQVRGIIREPYKVDFGTVELRVKVERIFRKTKIEKVVLDIYKIRLGDDKDSGEWRMIDNGNFIGSSTIAIGDAQPLTGIKKVTEWKRVLEIYNSGEII